MNIQSLIILSLLVWSCKPGNPLVKRHTNDSALSGPDLGSDAVPQDAANDEKEPNVDPAEEAKATEPAVIGGAYLYCDATKNKATSDKNDLTVGCRVNQVSDLTWQNATKQAQINGLADGAAMNINIDMPLSSETYPMTFSTESSLQSGIEMALALTLPQGELQMTSTLTTFHPKLATMRAAKGLTMKASIATPDGPEIDHKTWNLWMPLKIPQFIIDLDGSTGGGPGKGGGPKKGASPSVELSLDSTVCRYQKPSAGEETNTDKFLFESCSDKPLWTPNQKVYVKSISLTIKPTGANVEPISVAVTLETDPPQ